MGKKPVKDIEKRSERLSAYDQLCFLIETYQRVTHPFGFDIYRDDYKLNWALFYSFFVTISYTTNCVYWAVIAALNNNLDEVLKSVSCIPASFQHQCKVLSVIFCRKEIYTVHAEVLRLCKEATGEHEITFYKFNKLFDKIGRSIFYIYATAVVTLCINPLVQYLSEGEVGSFFNMYFPWVDNKTYSGYFINSVGQMMVMSNTGTVFAACDAFTCYYFLFTGEYEELIEQGLRDLSVAFKEAEEANSLRKKEKYREFHRILIRTIKMSQDVEQFFNKMKFFELLCLGQISCISATLMITVITLKITGWITLVTYIIAHLFQLGGYSFVGTYIETKYERLQISIYNLQWYYFHPSDQRLFQFFLQNSQTPKKFYLVGAQSINVATGLAIIKSIYSVIIMLDNVI